MSERTTDEYNGVAFRQGGYCYVKLDEQGRILESSAVRCVWSGTEKFHDWFVESFDIELVVRIPEYQVVDLTAPDGEAE